MYYQTDLGRTPHRQAPLKGVAVTRSAGYRAPSSGPPRTPNTACLTNAKLLRLQFMRKALIVRKAPPKAFIEVDRQLALSACPRPASGIGAASNCWGIKEYAYLLAAYTTEKRRHGPLTAQLHRQLYSKPRCAVGGLGFLDDVTYWWPVNPDPTLKAYQVDINTQLASQGYAPITADGRLGPGTCGAVKALQVTNPSMQMPKNCSSWTPPTRVSAPVSFSTTVKSPALLAGQKAVNAELQLMGLTKIAESGLLTSSFCGAFAYLVKAAQEGESLGETFMSWATTYSAILNTACNTFFTPPFPIPAAPAKGTPKPTAPFNPKTKSTVLLAGQKLLNDELAARGRVGVPVDGLLSRATCAGFAFIVTSINAGEHVTDAFVAWAKKNGDAIDKSCSLAYTGKYAEPAKVPPKKPPAKKPVPSADKPKPISCPPGGQLSADGKSCEPLYHEATVVPPASNMPMILLGVGAVALVGAVVYASSKKKSAAQKAA